MAYSSTVNGTSLPTIHDNCNIIVISKLDSKPQNGMNCYIIEHIVLILLSSSAFLIKKHSF